MTIQLFITCLVDSFFPKTGLAMVDVLNRLGVDVTFPTEQTCCGQPAFNAGLREDARQMAKHTIRVFEASSDAIVAPSGSCVGMIRHGYPELFSDDPDWLPRAEAIAARTYEFTEYLVDILGVTDVGAHWDGVLTYHPSCHLLRDLGIDRQPRELLAHVHGATIVELPHAEECCGFGGVFSVAHPEISTEMLNRKIENLEASQAPTLVLADTGCRMHIAGGLSKRKKTQKVVHIAEILAKR